MLKMITKALIDEPKTPKDLNRISVSKNTYTG